MTQKLEENCTKSNRYHQRNCDSSARNITKLQTILQSGCIHTDTSTSPSTGYSKQEFVCIPIASVHSNMGSVYKYELP